jgi:hypothetical protein
LISQVLYQAKVNANELNYVYRLGPQTTPLHFDFPTTGTGTIEIKSAWRLASDIGDTSRYHTAMATYYTGDEHDPKAQTAEFALLALHIIVKTANHPTFIFTTFEQIDSVIGADGSTPTGLYYIPSYTQIDYQPEGSSQNPSATYTGAYTTIKPTTPASDTTTTTQLPPGGSVLSHTTVVQPKTITSDVVKINNQVHSLLPSGSVWQYYALKGVQSLETNTTGSGSSRKGDETSPDYYLANIVVESSQPGVQLFRGGAPGPHKVKGEVYLHPQRAMNNVRAPDGTMVNIGGCMGCHGVAQSKKGQDFSFLADAVGLVGSQDSSKNRAPGFSPDVLPEIGTSVETIRRNVSISPRKLSAKNY